MLKFAKKVFQKKNMKNSSDERGSECWYLWTGRELDKKTLLARRFLFYDLIYGLFDLNDVTPDDKQRRF